MKEPHLSTRAKEPSSSNSSASPPIPSPTTADALAGLIADWRDSAKRAATAGNIDWDADVAYLDCADDLQAEVERLRAQPVTASTQELLNAHAALDEIGAPRHDGHGLFTVSGRCWALSNRFAEQQQPVAASGSAPQDEQAETTKS